MMTEGTKKKMKAIQEMKITQKPSINEVVMEIREMWAEMKFWISDLRTEVDNLRLMVMDLAELVSISIHTKSGGGAAQKGVAATLQEIIEKEQEIRNNMPTIDSESIGGTTHSESERGNKQQAVDFSQVAQEPTKALDAIPDDEFEFDFFDTQAWTDTSIETTAVAGDVVNVPSESGTTITANAVASADGDVEEFDPLASW